MIFRVCYQERGELDLRSTKEWVLIADVFKGQWTEAVIEEFNNSFGKLNLHFRAGYFSLSFNFAHLRSVRILIPHEY